MLPWVDVATGSLGQGLPDGVGVALAGKYLDELPYRVWVLCGDSEMAEDSIWEALDKASYYKLSNLIAMVDVNRLGQRGPTDLSWDVDTYAARAAAFGARVFAIDGHDLAAIDQAVAEAGHLAGHQPSVIVARTRKGRGFSEVEDREDWHGKPLPEHMAERAVVELGGERHLLVRGPARPRPASPGPRPAGPRSSWPATSAARRWPPAGPTATRWPRLASAVTWWPWTARSATRPSPTSSPRPTPSATSRCSSPSSSWSRPRWASPCAATGVRVHLRRVLQPGL